MSVLEKINTSVGIPKLIMNDLMTLILTTVFSNSFFLAKTWELSQQKGKKERSIYIYIYKCFYLKEHD